MNDQRVKRLSLRLTEALILTCQIPRGIQLVAILGTGQEADNREALIHWVKRYVVNPEVHEDSDMLGTLQDRLVADIEAKWL